MVTLAITTYNRIDMTLKSFAQVIDDPRITEIVIVDDCSTDQIFAVLLEMVGKMDKVKLYRNDKNLGCYHNKRRAVELASNEWVVLLDSDNVIDSSYLNAIDFAKNPKELYAPDFARPHFDYRHFGGAKITWQNVKEYSQQKRFDCLINTCNFLVNRAEYLRVFDQDMKEPWTADTLYFNYCWLKAGNEIHVVPGMAYEHVVHDGSHYQEHVRKTGDLAEKLMKEMT